MKIYLKCILTLVVLFFSSVDLQGQYGYGGGGYGYGGGGYGGRGGRGGYGRQRSSIPQAQVEPKKEEPKTAAEIVDGEMPNITEALELNEFETAVLSSILKKYLKQRIEMQILKLAPDQIRTGMEKITKNQTEELKAGLPLEKYEAFVAMQKKGIAKTKKETKKKKKRKKKSKN